MHYNKNIGLKIVGASLVLAISSVFCFSTPTTAHVINKDVLSIQIGHSNQESASAISSDLLVEGGQTILVPGDFDELIIPITISCSNQEILSKSEEGTVKAVSGNAEKMTVSLDAEKVLFEDAEETINLTICLSNPEVEITPETETPETETLETETTPETEVTSEIEAASETEIASETPTESEVLQEEELLSAEVTFVYGEHIISATIVIIECLESDEYAGNTGDTAHEETTVSAGDAAHEETTVSSGDAAQVRTTVSTGDAAYKDIAEDEPTDGEGGQLQFCPSVYHPSVEMTLIGGEEGNCTIGTFPAMTKYTLEDERYLLYGGGSITIPAGEKMELDLSLTGIKEDLQITTNADITYEIKYEELPELSDKSSPLIVTEAGIEIPLSCAWGSIEAIIEIEHLAVNENGVVWQATDNITVEPKNNDTLQFVPDQAEAGTYRATVLWIENEITLYQMEIPFFVQYKSVGRGGTGQ